MDTVAPEKLNEAEADDAGLFAHDERRHDAYSLPDEDAFVFCPECGSLGESFDGIDHEAWCFYRGTSIRPGNF